jgi:hypothetical protein
MKTDINIYVTKARWVLLTMRNVSDKLTEKIKPHILSSKTFSESRAAYQIMWKNIVERGRPQMAIWRMRIACWVPKAANTHPVYVVLLALPLRQWLHESVSIVRYSIPDGVTAIFQ